MLKKIFYTIPETLSYMESLKSKAERMPDLLGFKSSDIAKGYRHLIQISNSLAIVFLQYDLNDLSLIVLKYASDADIKLHRYGTPQDKFWEGSLITFNVLILLFHKVRHFKDSLKLVHQAQTFIISLKESKVKLSAEIEVCTHMLSFISLWRVGRSSESISFLQSATDILNSFIDGRLQTRMSQAGLDNLFGLIAASLAAVKLVVEKNKQEALTIIAKALNEIGRSAGCRGILENLLNFVSENTLFRVAEENQEDWLCGKMFTRIFIITSFIPLIDPHTPLIRSEELEIAKNGNIEQRKDAERPPPVDLRRSKVETIQELLKEDSPKVTRKYLNQPSQKKIKHWWENNSFVEKFDLRRSENLPAFSSEPRRVKRNRPTISMNLPKYIINSPSNYPRKNNSMLESISKRSYDDGSSTVRGFNIDMLKHHDNICD